MAVKDEVGRYGEGLVARQLSEQGWVIIDRNWRTRAGEIDIVARDGSELVAVEVKTRRSATFGAPQQAITHAKLARLRRLTAEWLAQQDLRFDGVRIDVVAVTLPKTGSALVEHFRGVG